MMKYKKITIALLSILFLSPAYTAEFPNENWTQKAPSEVGVDPLKVKTLFDLSFEDNAGLYKPTKKQHAGLGMDIVDKRLIHQFGQRAGLVIECRTNQFTRMSFSIPHTHYHSHQG